MRKGQLLAGIESLHPFESSQSESSSRPGEISLEHVPRLLGRESAGRVDVDVEPVLAYFSSSDGRNQYRKFVLEGIKEGHRAEYYEAAEGRILGDGNLWKR